jgi:hypothetical protein
MSERERLLRAVIVELAEGGYPDFSLEAAARRAGVDGSEIAEFESDEDCLAAAYELLVGEVVEMTTAGCEDGGAWPQRVRGSLEALAERLAGEPQLAQALMRGFPGINPTAYGRYVELLDRFVPFMREGREYSGVEEELPGEVELLAVGAAEAIIFNEVDSGRAGTLPGKVPEILFSVLVPFMGPEQAAEEMRSAAASA